MKKDENFTNHNFPKDTATVCDRALKPSERKELFKLCFEFGIEIADEALTEIKNERFPYLGYSNISGDKLTAFHVEKLSNNIYVSFEEFKGFIRGEGIIKKNKVELQVGKWYIYNGWILNFQGEKNKLLIAYGFEAEHFEWHELSNFGNNPELWEEATEEEVKEALTKEAVKRGYCDGVYMEDLYHGTKDFYKCNGNEFDYEEVPFNVLAGKMGLRDKVGNVIFCDGVWASLAPTITKEQAEKELGKKIID